jgi:hypothetical protein
MKGKPRIVSEVPGLRRKGKSGIDWDSPASLARLTGQPVLAAENVRDTHVKSLRQYTRSPFVDTTGYIAVHLRNSRLETDGHRYGDVFLQWHSRKDETKGEGN